MGLAGFEPATLGLIEMPTKNPSPKPGTLSRLDYRPLLIKLKSFVFKKFYCKLYADLLMIS